MFSTCNRIMSGSCIADLKPIGEKTLETSAIVIRSNDVGYTTAIRSPKSEMDVKDVSI